MALNNLAGLKASALAWIERTGDEAAETIISDCVTLCEARVNKVPNLRLSHMETEVTLTPADEYVIDLPSDCLAVKRVLAATDIPRLLSYAEPGWFVQAYPPTVANSDCAFYTIVGTTLRSRHSADLIIVYYAKVPALATTDPNWLLTKAPDVYLYGTVLELLNALEGVEGVEKYAGMFGAAVQGLIQSETFSRGGVLTVRAHMPAP